MTWIGSGGWINGVAVFIAELKVRFFVQGTFYVGVDCLNNFAIFSLVFVCIVFIPADNHKRLPVMIQGF